MSRLVKIVDNKYVQIEECRNPNICFNTSEYDDFEDYCTLRETFDPFEMFYENQELKKKYENAVVDYEITMFEKEQLNSLVNSCQEEIRQLKKQLEEWKHHLEYSKEMLDIQGQKGNYDFDEYMLGLYNGMEYIIALFETREPNFISGKDVEFTNNKTQQKEFIKYLENMLDDENDIFSVVRVKDVLQKYKKIIGVSDEKK